MAPPTIGRYSIVREIARGGMGIVYEAEDLELKRRVAIKTLPEHDISDADIARFRREATIAAQLRHPNIVVIHEVGTTTGSGGSPLHFIAMDFVEGRTFAEVLRDDAVPKAERLRMLEEVSRAVGHAHAQGVVHRDLKPANILVDKAARVVLTDFGLARASSILTRLTQSNTILGTPRYMAPEQVEARAGDIDARSDVYALGVILYEVLAGRPPFDSDVPAKLFHLIVNTDAAPPTRVAPWVERDLEVICLKAMEKERDRRYATALDFAEDLARFRRGEPVMAKPPSLGYRLRRQLGRRKAAVAAALVVVVLVAGFSLLVRQARGAAIGELRERTRTAMEAALELRRADSPEGFGRFAREVEDVCTRAMKDHPTLAEPHYRLGRMYRALMRDDDALRSQDAALERDPGFAPALYERVVLGARRYRRRIDELAVLRWGPEGLIIVRQPEQAKRWRLTRGELVSGDRPATELQSRMKQDLERLLRDPDVKAAEAACARGLYAWMKGDTAKADGELRQAIGADATLEEAYEALAGLDLDRTACDKAVEWFTEGAARDKGYLPHLEGRAFARIVRAFDLASREQATDGAIAEAIADLNHVLKRDGSRAEAWLMRGNAHLVDAIWRSQRGDTGSERLQAAASDFDAAGRLSPDDDRVLIGRGITRLFESLAAYYRGDDIQSTARATLVELDRAIAHNPSIDVAWGFRGVAHTLLAGALGIQQKEGMAECEAAVADLTVAIERNADRYENWMWRGVAQGSQAYGLALQGKDPLPAYERTIRDLDKAVELDGTRADAVLWRGQARLSWGGYLVLRLSDPMASYAAAIADFDRSVTLNPKNALAWRLRGNTHEAVGGWNELRKQDASEAYTKALADYAETVKLNPGVAPILTGSMAKLKKYLK